MFEVGNTFVFGETPSATKWDQIWRNDDALQDWSAFTADSFPISVMNVAFLATSSESIPNTTSHVITSYSEVFDRGADFASGVFTAPYDGLYLFTVNMMVNNPGADKRLITILLKNGSTAANSFGVARTSVHDPTGNIAHPDILAAGDQMSVQMFHDFGSNLALDATSSFGGFLVART